MVSENKLGPFYPFYPGPFYLVHADRLNERIDEYDKAIAQAAKQDQRSLLFMGARSVLAGLGDKQDRFSRWARNRVERRGYWKAAVAIAAKNLRLAWAVMHYGEDFRRIEETA